MNTKLLRKVAKRILAEPKGFIMGNVIQTKSAERPLVRETEMVEGKDAWQFPKCGTAACIAGWACVLSRRDADWVDAAGLLDISLRQADLLFGLWNWPSTFQSGFAKSKTPRGRAIVATRRIEHFIKTKGAE